MTPPPPSTELVFRYVDVSTLIRFSGLNSLEENPELVKEIIDIFLKTTPQTVQDLETAVGEGDVDSIRRLVHSLKGTVGTFGALHLAELCRQLDQQIKDGKRDGFAEPVAEILFEYACVREDLQAVQNHCQEL